VVSVVIPALDEERALPNTLDAVCAQRCAHEVIVVDGGSEDGTRTVVERAAARDSSIRLLEAERGRASQMNAGAAAASGDWLLFLHADTLLPAQALEQIEALPPGVDAGCFHQRFTGSSRALRLLSWFHNRRFRITRVIYGDQALFVRRPLFTNLGGFPAGPMEDIAFSLVLRAATRPVMLPLRVLTDARKFDQMGHARALWHAIGLLVRFRLGRDVSGDRFFGVYR